MCLLFLVSFPRFHMGRLDHQLLPGPSLNGTPCLTYFVFPQLSMPQTIDLMFMQIPYAIIYLSIYLSLIYYLSFYLILLHRPFHPTFFFLPHPSIIHAAINSTLSVSSRTSSIPSPFFSYLPHCAFTVSLFMQSTLLISYMLF